MVVLATPLNFTVEPETKFVPFTVMVKPAAPVVVAAGLMEEVVGTGLPGWRAMVYASPTSAVTAEGIVAVCIPVAPAAA